jgi:hypothetical protein
MFTKCFLLVSTSLTVIMALPFNGFAADPKIPTQVIRPFDQKDLKGFSTWLKKTQGADPQNVFTLKDGVLRCGDEDMGYLSTTDAYKDYHFKIEYRWGRKNPNDKNVRNSGVLLHGTGPDGSQNGVWKTSIECQLAQGCEGDLILIKGKKVDGESYPGSMNALTPTQQRGRYFCNRKGTRCFLETWKFVLSELCQQMADQSESWLVLSLILFEDHQRGELP